MDILLTPAEQELAVWAVSDDAEGMYPKADALCRAQVKKVVEFYQQIPVAGRPMHDVWADFLEALREAAGGEG